MKSFKIIAIFLSLLCSGCINLYTRCPGTNLKIIDTYQSTQESFAFSYIVMFPQIMNSSGSKEFYIENLITVPIGCLCFIDVACESVLDTVFWPIDLWISKERNSQLNNNVK